MAGGYGRANGRRVGSQGGRIRQATRMRADANAGVVGGRATAKRAADSVQSVSRQEGTKVVTKGTARATGARRCTTGALRGGRAHKEGEHDRMRESRGQGGYGTREDRVTETGETGLETGQVRKLDRVQGFRWVRGFTDRNARCTRQDEGASRRAGRMRQQAGQRWAGWGQYDARQLMLEYGHAGRCRAAFTALRRFAGSRATIRLRFRAGGRASVRDAKIVTTIGRARHRGHHECRSGFTALDSHIGFGTVTGARASRASPTSSRLAKDTITSTGFMIRGIRDDGTYRSRDGEE